MMELSIQQKKAVEYIGTPTLVIAGAGAGKTRTLTAKIAFLIQKGYDPARILAITFTNKAAEEMKNRLTALTSRPLSDFPWVRTYHSACFRILQKYCHLLGFTQPVQVYTGYQQEKIIKDIVVGKMNYDKKHVQNVLSQISNAKNFGNPGAYFELKPRVAQIKLYDVYQLYERELRLNNAVDFDNILFLVRDILRDNKKIREQYQNYFQYILCDEYQDTNNINEEITGMLLKNGNLFAVGDDWQSIYSFRMSDINHFLSFQKKYKDAKIFRLEQNYRSANNIVQTANDLIGFNKYKMDKKCFSKIEGGVIEIHKFPDDKYEAIWAAKKIHELNKIGIPFDKMAVLYRTKFCSLYFEQMFRKFGILYRMLGGKGFFDRKEILDLTAYLTAALFERDDTSFERIINIPKRGIGPGTVKKINDLRTENISLQGATRKTLKEKLLKSKVYTALNELIQLLDNVKKMPPDQAIQTVIHQVGYMEYIKGYSESDDDFISRKENIEQLIFSASKKDTILEYLEEAALVREDKDDDEGYKKERVNLSTIHASKGLEYHVVFVVACEEDLFPHWRSKNSAASLEEERRLMYVSMTRSERYLYLSHAESRKGQDNNRSRFLDEIRI